MRKAFIATRRFAQLMYFSRLGWRQPSILANSIPKSGTHLVKAILEGGGYSFVGHYNTPELPQLKMVEGTTRSFATAHSNVPVTGPGRRLLVYRDPADVALSMALYVRSRVDHPRHRELAALSLQEAVIGIFEGTTEIQALPITYAKMLQWALASEARGVNFDAFRKNPAMLFDAIGEHVVDLESIERAMSRWNPTKRTKKHPREIELKEALRQMKRPSVQKTFEIYREMQEQV